MIEIRVEESEAVTLVIILGSVDGMTADSLVATMDEQIKKGNVRLVADFSGVDYTSSAGLRALLATLKETRRRGGDLRLASVRPDVRKVLDLSGFTNILKLFDGVEQAVSSFAG